MKSINSVQVAGIIITRREIEFIIENLKLLIYSHIVDKIKELMRIFGKRSENKHKRISNFVQKEENHFDEGRIKSNDN
jgi:ABC-type ATPase involved in cell division